MEQTLFTNEVILSWLRFFTKRPHQPGKTQDAGYYRKNKNLIPTVMGNRAVLVFTDAGHPISSTTCGLELGDCDIWYNEDQIHRPHQARQGFDMINRGINASAAMLILNPNAATNYHIGMENSCFACGSVQYVCRKSSHYNEQAQSG